MRKRKRGSACANISREINGFLTVSRTTVQEQDSAIQQWKESQHHSHTRASVSKVLYISVARRMIVRSGVKIEWYRSEIAVIR